MEEFSKNLKKENLKEIFDAYLKVRALIEELNKNKKELPPKEEL